MQYYLEKGIEEMLDQFDAKNGATGIVMNAKTGGILAMASYPNYDLNDASTVQDARLRAAIEDGSASLSEDCSCASGATRRSTIPMSPARRSRS